ncbi:hypothetical protein [Kitasatospora aureofaciens]|uniref:hypothetical protein n=1 Tax=Kitasatospora aureofaciens TaxID=1894 RepID=UPI001C47B109|nr:hypothetical protein [Kitasatospora aureofaciens]MBV6696724.1 hypothetical protein [Kitasatospora aureofaciens]
MQNHSAQALAVCSPERGRLDLFLGAHDGTVRHKVFDGAWSAWRELGRPWPSPGAPGFDWLSATAAEGGPVELFALSSVGELWRLRVAGEEQGEELGEDRPEWTSLGVLNEASAATGFTAVTTQPGDLHVFCSAGAPSGEIVHWRPGSGPILLRPGDRTPGQLGAVAVAPGRVDLLVADTRERRLIRGHFADGPPVWDELGNLPERGGRSFTCFAATERDVFLGGDNGLWHSALDTWLGWEHLGGDLAARGEARPRLAAVSSGSGRTDVFAVWAGVALMHRWSDTAWSDWHLVDLLSGTPGSYAVLRPEDLVTLTVRGEGLQERTQPDGTVQLVAGSAGGRLIVGFPPQHLAETVLGSGSSSQGFLAGPSNLCFTVGQDPVTLTVAGLLDAMNRLPLATTAASAGGAVTSLELPWRLVLALEQPALEKGVRCAHRTLPAPGTGGGTELWHSRIAGPDGRLAVHPVQALAGRTDLNTPLDAWVDRIVAAAARHPNRPVAVDRLILSAYGARFSASAHWPELEWTHDAALGRDFYVRVSVTGALFPFGHRAAYVELDERRFDPTDPAVAALHRRSFLIVTEPVRDDYGIGAGGRHERTFPFQQVAIDPGQATDLDTATWIQLDPASCNAKCFWPTRGGQPVRFTLQARAGQESVELHLPLLFAEDAATGAGCAAALDALYGSGPSTGRQAALGRPVSDVGSRIPLAMVSPTQVAEGAVQEVQSMTFGGLGAGLSPTGVGFYPKVTQLAVGLPAARQLLGPIPAVPATFSTALVNTPWGAPPADALLDLVAPRTIDFGAAGARAGTLAAPNMTMTQISRTLGPAVGDALPTDPRKLFDPDATLFGVVPLRDLISVVTDQPKLLWTGEGTDTPSAKLTWKQGLGPPVAPFYPRAASSVSLEAVSRLVGGRPELHTTGVIDNFDLVIPEKGDAALVTLTFDSVRFTADPGQRLNLDVKLANVELNGNLKFLRTLAQLIPQAGRGGPRIDVSATEIKASYTLAVPGAGLMVFSLQNLTVQIGVTLSMTNRPIVIDFAFGTRERPFLVTVSGFGGGGYLEIELSAGGPDSGLQQVTGGIEFGAAVVMDFTIASAEVHVFGGVVFTKRGGSSEITGYLRIGGSVSVLGLISVSIELTLSLEYDDTTNVLSGSAKLVITVDLTFWSTSVTLECHKSFTGSSLASGADHRRFAPAAGTGASSVETALGPQGQSFPWQTYCRAFAGE